MNEKAQISIGEATEIGAKLGVDWARIEIDQFRRGLEVELEHGRRDPQTNITNDDMLMTGKIAWAHLKEFPDYYARLQQMEAEADAYWAPRRSAGDNPSPKHAPKASAAQKSGEMAGQAWRAVKNWINSTPRMVRPPDARK